MKISGLGFVSVLLMLHLLACTQEDSGSLGDRIINLQQQSEEVEVDAAIQLLRQAIALVPANIHDFDSLQAENNYQLGLRYDELGQIDSSAIYLHNACRLVGDQIKSDRQKEYFINAFLAYLKPGKYGDCLAISELYRSKLDEKKDFKWLSVYYYFQEQINWKTGKYEESAANNLEHIKYLRMAKDTLALTPALIFQAQIKYYYFKDQQGAFDILDELLSRENDLTTDYKRVLYGNYGIYLYYAKDLPGAVAHYSKSLAFAKQLEDSPQQNNFMATSWANIAECYLEMQDYKLAQVYIDSVRNIGLHKINNDLQESILQYQLRLSYETDKNINKISKDLDEILKFRNQQYLDKIDGELLSLTIANDKEKVLLEEKQSSEIEYIKLQSRLLLLLLIGALLALAGIFYYRQRQYKFDKQNLQMQQRLLRSQMNPHFTFNILYTIQRLIKKDKEAATKYLFTFSRLLRIILENSMHNYVQLDKELESLNKYFELQLLRFRDKFEYEIKLEELEEDDLVFIPPMLLQPFVENSIDHGFSGIDYLGKIVISLKLQGKYISCQIEDNGQGLRSSDQPHKQSVSIALISEYLKKTTNSNVEIIDKKTLDATQSGVVVNFLIPYNQNVNA